MSCAVSLCRSSKCSSVLLRLSLPNPALARIQESRVSHRARHGRAKSHQQILQLFTRHQRGNGTVTRVFRAGADMESGQVTQAAEAEPKCYWGEHGWFPRSGVEWVRGSRPISTRDARKARYLATMLPPQPGVAIWRSLSGYLAVRIYIVKARISIDLVKNKSSICTAGAC